jgi:hypothetical protein
MTKPKATIKPLSFSELSTFLNSDDDWVLQYVIGIRPEPSPAMTRGSDIHAMLLEGVTARAYNPNYCEEEQDIHRSIEKAWGKLALPPFQPEKTVMTNIGAVPVLGIWDGYDEATRTLYELKTGRTLWSRKRALEHGQLAMYAWMHAEAYGMPLEKVVLVSASTANGKVVMHEMPIVEFDQRTLTNMYETVQDVWNNISDYHKLRKQR